MANASVDALGVQRRVSLLVPLLLEFAWFLWLLLAPLTRK